MRSQQNATEHAKSYLIERMKVKKQQYQTRSARYFGYYSASIHIWDVIELYNERPCTANMKFSQRRFTRPQVSGWENPRHIEIETSKYE